jgi:hypothetical protein
MKNGKINRYPIPCILLAALCFGLNCTGDIIAPDETPDPVQVMTYTIDVDENLEVFDSLTGNIFQFPDGGSGELTIRLDTAAVTADSINNVFTMAYSGSGDVLVLVKKFTDGYSGLMRYYKPEWVLSETDTSLLNWYTMPVVKDSGGYIYCTVELSDTGLYKSPTALKKSGRFLSFSHSEESQATKTWDFFSKAVGYTIDSMLVLMAPALASTAKTRIDGDYKYSVTVYDWFKSNYSPQYRIYDGSIGKYLLSKNRDIMLLSDNDLSNVAHETGHYLHHVLAGTEKFKTFAVKPIAAKHEFGMMKSRDNLIEEFAYLVEFLMEKKTKGGNPENGSILSGGFAGDENIALVRDPGKVDFPSLEGFTVCMFASVLRTTTEVKPFTVLAKDIPVVTSITPGDIFTWEHLGGDNVDGFRDSIESRLTPSEKTVFPVIMHSLGWTYAATGTIADRDKKTIPGCRVYNVIFNGSAEYIADSSEATSLDGIFHIRYSFAGASIFKVKYNLADAIYRDSAFFTKTIDWKKPTTELIRLDTLTVTLASPVGRVRNIMISIPGSEPMYGLDISAGLVDDVALTTDRISLYVHPWFTPSAGLSVTGEIDVDFSITVDDAEVKSGTVSLSPTSDRKNAEGRETIDIGTLTKGNHVIRLTLDPELKITDRTLSEFNQYRVIDHEIDVVDSYL